MRTWFGAIFLMATSSKGVSAMVLSRQLGLGNKTAGRKLNAATIAGFVYDNADRASVLLTDDLPGRRWIGRKFPARPTVIYSKGEYVRRDPLAATTAQANMVESFNPVLKRCWVGVHRRRPIKQLHRYLNQLVFLWDHRKTTTSAKLADLFRAPGRRLRFQGCVA